MKGNMDIETLLMTSLSLDTLRSGDNIFKSVLLFALMYGVKQIGSLSKVATEYMKKWCKKRVEEKMETVITNVQSTIVFTREFDSSKTADYEYIDAIIDHFCNLDSVKKLSRKQFFMFNSRDEFEVNPDIYGKLIHIEMENNEQIKSVKFVIYSNTLPLSKLKLWCNSVLEKYRETQQQKLLVHKYYFNQMSREGLPGIGFTKTIFTTTKSLNNLFGVSIVEAKKRLDMFLNNKDWYVEKGIPYSLGFLLSGSPGCGKTSFIKAIAGDTGRHIINLQLTENTRVSDLNNLFYNESLNVQDRTGFKSLDIPFAQRLYVLEDADCLTDIVLSRKHKKPEAKEEKDKNFEKEMSKKIKEMDDSPRITLSHLLNILDGILEIDGRMIVMTTNHIEKIDEALKRPGRFDFVVEFKKFTSETINEMIYHLFGKKFDVGKKYNLQFTPAQIQEVLLSNLYEPLEKIPIMLDKMMSVMTKEEETKEEETKEEETKEEETKEEETKEEETDEMDHHQMQIEGIKRNFNSQSLPLDVPKTYQGTPKSSNRRGSYATATAPYPVPVKKKIV
jgi:predicted AAA+ superfamily ATPase